MYPRCECGHFTTDHTSLGCFWCNCAYTRKEADEELDRRLKKSKDPLDNSKERH